MIVQDLRTPLKIVCRGIAKMYDQSLIWNECRRARPTVIYYFNFLIALISSSCSINWQIWSQFICVISICFRKTIEKMVRKCLSNCLWVFDKAFYSADVGTEIRRMLQNCLGSLIFLSIFGKSKVWAYEISRLNQSDFF